jgi:hypothetical protein
MSDQLPIRTIDKEEAVTLSLNLLRMQHSKPSWISTFQMEDDQGLVQAIVVVNNPEIIQAFNRYISEFHPSAVRDKNVPSQN